MDAALAALLELEVLDDVREIDGAALDADRLEGLVELAPRRPTKTLPARSSRSPGISPTIMIRAPLGPLENTVCVARSYR
jgi:hypothetical protein